MILELFTTLASDPLNVLSVFLPLGAILGFMLGVFKMPVKECEDLYRKLGSDVFKQNVIVGTVKMGWNHAFYDTEAWENILKSVDLSMRGYIYIYLYIYTTTA